MAKIQLNGKKIKINGNYCIKDLIKKFKLKENKIAIELNGVILPKKCLVPHSMLAYGVGFLSSGGFLPKHLSSAHARVARADRAGHAALACPHREFQFRSKKAHALLSNRCRRALAGWDGHCPPRMDTCGVRLRSEQPRLLCSCRHAAAGSRHSPASEPRVCLLGRHLVGYKLLAACCAPSASTRWRRQHGW